MFSVQVQTKMQFFVACKGHTYLMTETFKVKVPQWDIGQIWAKGKVRVAIFIPSTSRLRVYFILIKEKLWRQIQWFYALDDVV